MRRGDQTDVTLCFNALGEDFVAEFNVTCTCAPYAGKSPDMNQPGEPPEPAEFEASLNGLWRDAPNWNRSMPRLETPQWLITQLELWAADEGYERIVREFDE